MYCIGKFVPVVADNILIFALCAGIGLLMLVKGKNLGKEDKNGFNA